MTVSKIKPEEIDLLCRLLFLPKEVIIFDPKQALESTTFCTVSDITRLLKKASAYQVCINLSDQKLEVLSFDFILDFGKAKKLYKSFYRASFLTIQNPDGSIRWFLPETAKNPDFLSLYNSSGLKSKLFSLAANTSFSLGLQKWFCHGQFNLYSKEADYFKNKFEQADVAVFTGTVGENRKAVVALCEQSKATHFIKVPVSGQSKKLIQEEHRHLSALNQFDFKKVCLPDSTMKVTGIQLSNIKPAEVKPGLHFQKTHIDALKDLYANTFQMKMFSKLDTYKDVSSWLEEIRKQQGVSDQIPRQKTERLAYNLKILLHAFDKEAICPVAYTHGDFTPWNMFVTEECIHLYDWELAMPEQLLLYDAFHHIFQTGVLILHEPFLAIKDKIERLERMPEIVDLIERYRIDFRESYRWYLIRNCSYYLNLYMKQQNLHKQAHWLLDCWIAASTDAIKSPKRKAYLTF